MKHNIILVGYMGSGKTCVGEYLAKRLSYQFQDTDQLIEKKAGDTINNIFASCGEEYFRDLETGLLKELVPLLTHTVLSTGGGMPLRKENGALLRELGLVVFLKASKETTLDRLRGDASRPLLQGDGLEEKVENMLGLRLPVYENTAHGTVVTDGRTIEEIANSIMELYEDVKEAPTGAERRQA
ncbi:MAG TPA: shikimate kinase [Clostridiales bacterium]|nr:shikimate kinase [Clostridiales bacterium]